MSFSLIYVTITPDNSFFIDENHETLIQTQPPPPVIPTRDTARSIRRKERKKKRERETVNVSKVGRVNEFPYQIRAASCHESLLLSLSSINTTYRRSARRLANNTKTATRRNLTRGHSFIPRLALWRKQKKNPARWRRYTVSFAERSRF